MNDIKALLLLLLSWLLFIIIFIIIFFELTPLIVRCYVTVDSLAYLRRA